MLSMTSRTSVQLCHYPVVGQCHKVTEEPKNTGKRPRKSSVDSRFHSCRKTRDSSTRKSWMETGALCLCSTRSNKA